jgi:hypothetical protein
VPAHPPDQLTKKQDDRDLKEKVYGKLQVGHGGARSGSLDRHIFPRARHEISHPRPGG